VFIIILFSSRKTGMIIFFFAGSRKRVRFSLFFHYRVSGYCIFVVFLVQGYPCFSTWVTQLYLSFAFEAQRCRHNTPPPSLSHTLRSFPRLHEACFLGLLPFVSITNTCSTICPSVG